MSCRTKSETNSGWGLRLHGELRWRGWQPVRTRFGEDLEFGKILKQGSSKMIRVPILAAFLFLIANQTSAAPTKHWFQKGPLGATERSIGCMTRPWKDRYSYHFTRNLFENFPEFQVFTKPCSDWL